MLKVNGGSRAAYNLFWRNGKDFDQSNIDMKTTLTADPLLDDSHRLRPNSPAIDAGTPRFPATGKAVLELSSGSFSGRAPDIGAFEFVAKK